MLTTTRKKFKEIDVLTKEEEVKVTDQAGMCEIAKNYFKNLFVGKDIRHELVIKNIHSSISSGDNELLIVPVTKE